VTPTTFSALRSDWDLPIAPIRHPDLSRQGVGKVYRQENSGDRCHLLGQRLGERLVSSRPQLFCLREQSGGTLLVFDDAPQLQASLAESLQLTG
jgi:hypothetical protein